MPDPLDGLAPYPRRVEDVTAEALARCSAVRVQMLFRKLTTDPTASDVREEAARTSQMIAEFGLVMALRALIAVDPEAADEAAVRMWLAWHDGGEIGSCAWNWLSGYGIDPEAVSRLAAEQRAEQVVSRG